MTAVLHTGWPDPSTQCGDKVRISDYKWWRNFLQQRGPDTWLLNRDLENELLKWKAYWDRDSYEKNGGYWDLVFPTEADKLVFLLRWS
jgi:hypothetical protein